jgi:hypothetical protein
MQNLLARLIVHARIVSIGFAILVLIVAGGYLLSRAPQASARQPQGTVGTTMATPPATPAPAEEATPAPAPVPAPAAAPASSPWPERVAGRVVDAQKQPLAGVSVVANGAEIRTDEKGAFTLSKPSGPVIV